MSKHTFFAFNHPFVVSELLDGEAVIMNLKTGNYYSARHTGALVWAWLEQGRALEEMASDCARHYGGEAADYTGALEAFMETLLEQGLVLPSDTAHATANAAVIAPPARYLPPLLEVYADMQDLLLLDPIHDIDEAGWPVAKPALAG